MTKANIFIIVCLIFQCVLAEEEVSKSLEHIDSEPSGNSTLRPTKKPANCTLDVECPTFYVCDKNACHHKNILPLESSEYTGSIFLMVLIGFANAGGLGGGPILLPLLIGFFHYSQKKATKLIYVMLFGGSLANYLSVFKRRNKKTGGPLVNYDLILLTLPLLMVGAVFGVIFNRVLPEIWLTLYLTYILYDSFKKTYGQATKLYKIESEQRNELGQQMVDLKDLTQEDENKEKLKTIPQSVNQLLEEERNLFPEKKFFFMTVLLIFLIAITLIKGNDKAHSIVGIEYCHTMYWLINVIFVIVFYGMFNMISDYIIRKDDLLKNLRPHQIFFTEDKAKKIGRSALKAGFLGALLGIGGGIILNPIWLSMGFIPEEVTSTAVLSIFFLSLTSLLMVLIARSLTIQEFVFFFCLSFFGSYLISEGIKAAVKKYNRPSIILFVLVSVLGLALVTLPIFGLLNATEGFFHFSSFC